MVSVHVLTRLATVGGGTVCRADDDGAVADQDKREAEAGGSGHVCSTREVACAIQHLAHFGDERTGQERFWMKSTRTGSELVSSPSASSM